MERVRSMAELIAYVPHLVGHHPHDSLVLVAMDDGARTAPSSTPGRHAADVVCTARVDLPSPGTEGAFVVDVLDRMSRLPGVDALVALTFEHEADESGVEVVLGSLAEHCPRIGLRLIEVARVRSGEYRVGATGQERPWLPCPRPESVPAVASRVVDGSAPFADRGMLEASLRPGVGPACPRVERALARRGLSRGGGWRTDVQDVVALWHRTLVPPSRPDGGAADGEPEQVAAFVQVLADPLLRDAFLLWACPLSMSPLTSSGPGERELLCRLPMIAVGDGDPFRHLMALLPSVPRARSVDLLVVLAMIAWWRGRGDVARVVLDRALSDRPEHRLGMLLATLVERGIRMSRVPASSRVGERPGHDTVPTGQDVLVEPGREPDPRPLTSHEE